jgi:DNA mismatch repair protein MutS
LFEHPSVSAKPQADALRTMLADLDPDQLTPRQALETLYKLKTLSTEEKINEM